MAGLAIVGAGALAGCEPGGLGAAAVAYTTDKTATDELKRRHVDVNWLSCTADYGNHGFTPGRSPSPTESTVVSVDCQGQTGDRQKITVTGKVTKSVDGACVRGSLTATVAGRRVFHVDGLGDCSATPAPVFTPPATVRPPGQPEPTVTVTVTRTLWCKGDPTCWPVEGK